MRASEEEITPYRQRAAVIHVEDIDPYRWGRPLIIEKCACQRYKKLKECLKFYSFSQYGAVNI